MHTMGGKHGTGQQRLPAHLDCEITRQLDIDSSSLTEHTLNDLGQIGT